ncbi:hypothetical protein [Sphingomonas sp. BK580]|uniref:hypothetical protein n=1 Tax=Sphingomonas sp. BK580 TaxID=2586972 RepID=UPI00161F24A3|nr:hypothetical protein [Sphingomonas sp. BK580]MBB3693173.1 hypothetical protein [Sphingomonas sp. BK580]
MPEFRISITDDEATSEGIERHESYAAARRSAVQTALAFLFDREVLPPALAATCEIRNEETGLAKRFNVDLHVGGDRLV